MTFLALILAMGLVLFVLDNFNALTDKGITVFTPDNYIFLLLLFVFALILGLISGSYPAFYLSSLSPYQAIKGTVFGKSSKFLRNSLVTVQILVSLVLIISTLVVSGQMKYFQSTNFGFNKEHMVIIPIKDREQNKRHETLTTQLRKSPGIQDATFTSSIPGNDNFMSFYYRSLDSNKEAQRIATFLVDDNFKEAFDLKEIEGLDLPINQVEDTIQHIIVNKSFVDFFELENPVGSYVQSGVMSKIIAVVEDFNIKSLHHKHVITV